MVGDTVGLGTHVVNVVVGEGLDGLRDGRPVWVEVESIHHSLVCTPNLRVGFEGPGIFRIPPPSITNTELIKGFGKELKYGY